MENKKNFMAQVKSIYKFLKGKKILITGHSGFKGSWLALWLIKIGCSVVGISKSVEKNQSNFYNFKFQKKIKNYFLNVKDFKKLKKVILKEKPDIIFHLAAQAIVSESYKKPIDTIKSNTLGSLNLLHSASLLKKKCICVMITSDKCYFNLEKNTGYKEESRLGGKDMYSGSKAAAEILINSYFHSFSKKNKLSFCTARAGNVIGGGDWSINRLVPDIMKARQSKRSVIIKNSQSIRPWQHVFEPLYGYLKAAYYLSFKKDLNGETFNFGPSSKKSYKVIDLLNNLNDKRFKFTFKKNKNTFKETKILKLNSKKALQKLNWKTRLSFKETSTLINDWYDNYFSKHYNIYDYSINQIDFYEKKIK